MKKSNALEERRTELLGVMLLPTEKQLVEKLAMATGATMSEIGRLALLEFLRLRGSEGPVKETP